MTKAILAFLVLSGFNFAQAEVPSYSCGYKTITGIVRYDETNYMMVRKLSSTENNRLKNFFDDSWNCDQGVDLIGVSEDDTGFEYKANCSKDGLGINEVSLQLTCVEDYLI